MRPVGCKHVRVGRPCRCLGRVLSSAQCFWKRLKSFAKARPTSQLYAVSNPTNPAAQRMEKIVSLCKRRGFIFQSSEIYGGLNGSWDYGPLGVELKRNLKNHWWRTMVQERDDVVGLDGA